MISGLRAARLATAAVLAAGLLALPVARNAHPQAAVPLGPVAVAAGPPAVEVALADRSYLLVEPPGGGAGLPVVVALHGRTGSAAAFLDGTGLDALAAASRAVVVAALVAPQVTARGGPTAWNAGSCCDAAAGSAVDDAGFVASVVADAAARTGADPGSVVAAGFSNGAMLGYRIACTRPGLLAGLVAVAGTRLAGPCRPSPALRLVHLHGAADAAVPVAGTGWSPLLRTALPPVADAVAPFEAAGGDVDVRIVPGLRHRWPDSGDPVDATRVVADVLAGLSEAGWRPAAPTSAAQPPRPPSS